MKKNLFTLVIVAFSTLCFYASVSAQTIRRVNTMPGLTDPTFYPTIQAAHDASVAGDIIYVEPANSFTTTYPDVVINRRITLIGTGYNLYLNTGTSHDKRSVGVETITLDYGSNGSKITGLSIGTLIVKDANCKIERNVIGGVYGMIQLSAVVEAGPLNTHTVLSTANNTMIYNNIIGGYGINGQWSDGFQVRTTTNCIITNNIFNTSLGISIAELTGTVISKNIINSYRSGTFNIINGCSISANIFDTRGWQSAPLTLFDYDGGISYSNGNTLSNNLCTAVAVLPTGNGNVNSANAASVFKVANPWDNFLESNFELSSTSPALTAGTGGTPIGAFSGNTPYILSGLPNIPIITDFSINNVGNANSPLQINVKARSNN